jgi:hypothetical protein
MAQTPIGLRLDDDLLRRVDEARGDVPRARYIAAALEAMLAGSGSARAQRLDSARVIATRGSSSPSLARFR